MLEQIHVLCSRKTYNNHTGRSRPNTDNASRMRQIFCFNSFSFCAHKRKTTTYIASVRVVLPRSAISGSAPASKGSVPRANMVPASCRSSLEGGGGCWRGVVARGAWCRSCRHLRNEGIFHRAYRGEYSRGGGNDAHGHGGIFQGEDRRRRSWRGAGGRIVCLFERGYAARGLPVMLTPFSKR